MRCILRSLLAVAVLVAPVLFLGGHSASIGAPPPGKGGGGGGGGGGPAVWPIPYRMVMLADSQIAPGAGFWDFELGNGSNLNNNGAIVGWMQACLLDADENPLLDENDQQGMRTLEIRDLAFPNEHMDHVVPRFNDAHEILGSYSGNPYILVPDL